MYARALLFGGLGGGIVAVAILLLSGASIQVAEWLSAIGTVGAVIIALYYRKDRPNVKVFGEYKVDYFYPRRIAGVDDDGEPIWGEAEDNWDDLSISLNIYVSNLADVSSLVKSWSFVDSSGVTRVQNVSEVVPGNGVVVVNRNWTLGEKDDWVLDELFNSDKRIVVAFFDGREEYIQLEFIENRHK